MEVIFVHSTVTSGERDEVLSSSPSSLPNAACSNIWQEQAVGKKIVRRNMFSMILSGLLICKLCSGQGTGWCGWSSSPKLQSVVPKENWAVDVHFSQRIKTTDWISVSSFKCYFKKKSVDKLLQKKSDFTAGEWCLGVGRPAGMFSKGLLKIYMKLLI